MKPKTNVGRFAERELRGVDDQGQPEKIIIWIERRPGATWSVGRMVNPERRPNVEAGRERVPTTSESATSRIALGD